MTTPERSIVHVSLEGESAKPDSAPKVVAGVSRVERYDGVLGSDGGECHQLISDEPLFEDNSAQSAYNKYSLGDFEEAAKSFEALVAKNALSSDDKQKALFLLGLIALKDPQKANNAVAMFKTASSIDAPLRRVAADYGIQVASRQRGAGESLHRISKMRRRDLRNNQRYNRALCKVCKYRSVCKRF